MDKIDKINEFIKIFFISIYMFYIYVKMVNYKDNNFYKTVIIVLSCAFISFIDIFLINFVNPGVIILFLYFIYNIVLAYITETKLINSTIIVVISFAIVYTTYIISVIITGILIYLFNISINNNNPLINIIINLVEILLLIGITKIKRIKNGLNFIKSSGKMANTVLYVGFLGGIVLTIFGLLKGSVNVLLNSFLLSGTLLIFITLIIWTQNQITKQYKRNMRDRTIEIQTKEIVEQSKIIKEIKEENLKLAETIHKYNNRLSALELGIANALKNNNKTEFANELGLMLEETKELSKNFAEETTINKTNLPKTNITGLDNMFKYFQNEANKNNIDFNVIINENIEDLLKIIDKPKLETLIGDHLKDAIIAVNKSKNPYKSILVILGISNKGYEISICDSGIEFEIDTLLKLGKERVTTHKEEGGSGIGFITTFKTLKETKASLEIEEYNPKTTNYTKSIVIRFDGKNEYRIYSYRAEEIKKKNNEKRIIIEEL